MNECLQGETPSAVADCIASSAATAASWVTVEARRRMGRAISMPGGIGRLASHADICEYAAFLAGAVALQEAGCFREYLAWSRRVQAARGVPDQALSLAIDLLGAYYRHHLSAEAWRHAGPILDAGAAALAEPPRGDDEAHSPSEDPKGSAATSDVEALTRHLQSGNIVAARALMLRWIPSGYVETSVRLIQPALYEIGVLWERNDITVSDEHRATAICETLLAQSFTGYPSYSSSCRRALFAGVGGNRHLVGPRMVADAFALRGWRSEVMDSGTTPEMLAARIDAARPDMAGLSVSLVAQLPALQRTVSVLRCEFGAQCPAIVVGGLSTNRIDGLWQRIDCDAWGNSALDVERLAV